MANSLTICRIVLCVALLISDAFSPAFFLAYALAGLTDMLDGYVARKTNSASELGARLDSIADLVLVIVCLEKLLPVIDVPIWLWAIALVKVVNVASGLVVERRLVMPHTLANKVAGFATFLVPLAIPLFGVVSPAIIACVVATFAAIQEGHLIRTGSFGAAVGD